MVSARAQRVAEILWKLKRADKLATYTAIAQQAGFSPGAGGNIFRKCLQSVRKDWPHLEWWRAVQDDGTMEKDSEQAEKLRQAGFELEETTKKGKTLLRLCTFEDHLMVWDEADEGQTE